MTGDTTARQRWNSRYARSDVAPFGTRPSEFVRQVVARSDFVAPSALMLADGDGRNGRWLAARLQAVTAVDASDVATDRAREMDLAAGVAVERVTADLAEWSGTGRRFGSAFIIALHAERAVRRRAVALAIGHVGTDGWIAIEGFSTAQGALGTMGPSDPERLYDLAETLGWLDGLVIVEAMSGRIRLNEGPRHAGDAEVIQVVARKR